MEESIIFFHISFSWNYICSSTEYLLRIVYSLQPSAVGKKPEYFSTFHCCWSTVPLPIPYTPPCAFIFHLLQLRKIMLSLPPFTFVEEHRIFFHIPVSWKWKFSILLYLIIAEEHVLSSTFHFSLLMKYKLSSALKRKWICEGLG